jgi:ATP-binding cassette subfamily B protein
MLGERGVRMSGGQRQRLAVARALVRDPSILILDEATSALDAQTEAEILETLAEAARGRTTISITHRLSLAARADTIVVLAGGRVVETGTHAELVRAGGPYRRLHDEQTAHVGPGVDAERLRSIPLFAGLEAEALAGVAGRVATERYDAGAEVVRQGEEGRKLYLVGGGRVEVVVAEDGSERRVNELGEGEFFGELALLTGEARSATVRTTMPSELYSLSRADFLALLELDAGVRRAVEEAVAARRLAHDEAARATSALPTHPSAGT